MPEQSKTTRMDMIRNVWIDELHGWGGMRALAEACVQVGVYSENDVRQAGIRALMSDCRAAIKAKNDRGLPHGLPSSNLDEDGAPIWGQLELLPKEDIFAYLQTQDGNVRADASSVIVLRDWCLEKFGDAPPLHPALEILAHA